MKTKSSSFHVPVLTLGILSFMWAAYAGITGSSIFASRVHSADFSSVSDRSVLVGAEVDLAFRDAQSKLSHEDEQLMDMVSDNRSIGNEAKPLLDKVDSIYNELKPEADVVNQRLADINHELGEKTFKIQVEDGDRPGELIIPLAEGLLAEYGPTSHYKGVLVSAEKDDYGFLPVTEGVSYREIPKIAKEFERLKNTSDYTKSVELAHASFLRNWAKYGCNWNLSSTCQRPDGAQFLKNDTWFKNIKKEVVMLRAKRKALENLQKVALRLEMTRKKLAQRLSRGDEPSSNALQAGI